MFCLYCTYSGTPKIRSQACSVCTVHRDYGLRHVLCVLYTDTTVSGMFSVYCTPRLRSQACSVSIVHQNYGLRHVLCVLYTETTVSGMFCVYCTPILRSQACSLWTVHRDYGLRHVLCVLYAETTVSGMFCVYCTPKLRSPTCSVCTVRRNYGLRHVLWPDTYWDKIPIDNWIIIDHLLTPPSYDWVAPWRSVGSSLLLDLSGKKDLQTVVRRPVPKKKQIEIMLKSSNCP
jgi:hypothetical protein